MRHAWEAADRGGGGRGGGGRGGGLQEGRRRRRLLDVRRQRRVRDGHDTRVGLHIEPALHGRVHPPAPHHRRRAQSWALPSADRPTAVRTGVPLDEGEEDSPEEQPAR